MLTVLLHVTPGTTGARCELRQCVAGTWQTVAGHDLPDAPPDRTALAGGPAAAGELLTGLLLRDNTRRAWEELRDASPYGMRTLVQVDPPDLQVLNWEWMALARAAFPDRIHPVVRARGLDRDDVRLELPLRLLAVVGDHAELSASERGIERAIAAAREAARHAPRPGPTARRARSGAGPGDRAAAHRNAARRPRLRRPHRAGRHRWRDGSSLRR
jgi:hypothetical protein